MEHERPLQSVSDDELLNGLARLVGDSRRVESELVAHLAEVDERRLYAREASPSLFAYCTQLLHLSEAEAYLRIAAARASREHPALLAMLADGRLHLSAIAKLAPHLTPENRGVLLERATHCSKREIEEIVAEVAPRPDAPATMRKLPERPPSPPVVPAVQELELRLDGVDHRRAVARPLPAPRVEPLAPARYKVQFTASTELCDKLERLRALMRSTVPDGDLAAIIEEAVTEKLERLEARRYGSTRAPGSSVAQSNTAVSSRHIPAAVRRAVRKRDGDRCRFVDPQGRRCTERHRLEFHHRRPFALGGDHSPGNVVLLCRSHNRLLAEHDYGAEAIARHIDVRRRAPRHDGQRNANGFA